MTARNGFEAANRQLKVNRLLACIERDCRIDATTAELIIDNVTSFPPDFWVQLAAKAGCRPPSQTTVAACLAEIRRRGLEGRVAPSDEPPQNDFDEESEPDLDLSAFYQELEDADKRTEDDR